MTARIIRRLTRSDLVGTVAGLLVALDGLHIVMSRTALLDITLMFLVLAAFGFLLLDRDAVRRRADAWRTLWEGNPVILGPGVRPAALADRRGGLARAGLRGQVERPLVRRVLRPAHASTGTSSCAASSVPDARCTGSCCVTRCRRS